MSRKLLLTTLTLALLFSATILLIRAQPYNGGSLLTLLTPPPGCAAPCLLGIRPGETSVEQAAAILEQQGWIFRGGAWIRPTDEAVLSLTRGGELVTHITLSGLRLGDVQLALGQPNRIVLYNSIAQGAKPYDLIYSAHSLYVLVDLYICDLSQTTLWTDPEPISVHVANKLVNRYDVNPNFFISADELDLTAWANQLRNLNSCKGETRS